MTTDKWHVKYSVKGVNTKQWHVELRPTNIGFFSAPPSVGQQNWRYRANYESDYSVFIAASQRATFWFHRNDEEKT